MSSGGTVFSAAGVWPLLAFLADGAQGTARAELARALGVPADQAAAAARELLAGLARVRALDSALGLWTGRTLEPREEWRAGLPTDAHGVLTGDPALDRREMDAWAAKRTGGLIERMPVEVRDDTELVLASALALRTTWLRPFRELRLIPETGPWADRELLGLYRTSQLLDRVGVADTPDGHVTELKVLGDTAVDVHLLLGEEHMTAGQVLGAGIGLLARRWPVVSGFHLPYGEPGPGLHVFKRRSARPLPPTLTVGTPAFDIRAGHDLLELHRLFGLTAARDAREGHFPGISPSPLAVGSARQSTTATFGAKGFHAAAVTAVGALVAGVPDLRWITTGVQAVFDRPFGFLAVHRHSRLALMAGWVTDPEPYPDDDALLFSEEF
ncbi:serpin family protein [Streptomyces sp. NPDC006335]|uniref:serpin family protein n=1 Tax=Streptomyces sp. NPDC006335 TaxID=3156895 RepID=UPI00339FEF46